MGGNLIKLPGGVTTPTADLTTPTLIFYIVISYLKNPIDRYEYMKIPLEIIPDEIIQQYKLQDLSHKGFAFM